MEDISILTNLTQLGAAGVIGWLWLSERRASVGRERELSEAHTRIIQERESTEALVTLVRENTAALSRLSESQRALGLAIDRLASGGGQRTREGAPFVGERRARP